ncbi:putative AAA+ superfamily ATPase [Aequitasia blattaphilus]|uniref:ATP-binding protein n=1 Tax=Aequitasia blattaphilus TaxID=2949332 RepID=A0ABT1EBL2_9FIRM|nr:ATP-binding protein [Aequitasia blattaphilus]MCP1103229.1 ATP-binding protein [Aequitasia blattaphilus]MCR8615869.1 ATP-binding protein [Aequitasia blattaphilus]
MIKREGYLKKIRPFYDNELVKVIFGIRRCGKSILLQQIIDELVERGVENEQIIFINFEDLKYAGIKNALALNDYVLEKIIKGKKTYLFFDEIQEVEEWEKAINSFRATLDCDIYITGSNSKLLSGELATHLSGRYISIKIMPFTFAEACEYMGKSKNQVNDDDIMNYINWGGMPQQLQFENERDKRVFLQDLYNSIILRDIVERNKIKDVGVFKRVLEYLIQTPAQIFSATSVSKYFESINLKISTETLYNYIEFAVSSMIIDKVKRYDVRGKRVLTRSDKIYLTDLGFDKIVSSGMKVEIGPLLENTVYNELIVRGYQVYVGKTTKGEIDFVASKDGKNEYYQVAYLLATEDVIEREFGAFKDITDNYPKYVLSLDKFDFSRDGIIHKNMIDFLLEGK